MVDEYKYIELLLNKNQNCKIIFLQTDDYNCFINLQNYIKEKNLNIIIYTLCDKNSSGAVIHNSQKNILNNVVNSENSENKKYLTTIIDKLNNTKAVEDMNDSEIYKHTIDMIIGIDIILTSNICITDYQSNVSRFIKLTHKYPENVYDIMSSSNNINYEKKVCPAYSF